MEPISVHIPQIGDICSCWYWPVSGSHANTFRAHTEQWNWIMYYELETEICSQIIDIVRLTRVLFVWHARRDLSTFTCHQQLQECYDQKDVYVSDMKNFACKHHYLVSTKAQPGVYNSPFHVRFSSWVLNLMFRIFFASVPYYVNFYASANFQ